MNVSILSASGVTIDISSDVGLAHLAGHLAGLAEAAKICESHFTRCGEPLAHDLWKEILVRFEELSETRPAPLPT